MIKSKRQKDKKPTSTRRLKSQKPNSMGISEHQWSETGGIKLQIVLHFRKNGKLDVA